MLSVKYLIMVSTAHNNVGVGKRNLLSFWNSVILKVIQILVQELVFHGNKNKCSLKY